MAVENFMTITYNLSEGIAARAVIAMLARLNPGVVIDDITTDEEAAPAGLRRLVIIYHEPAESGD